MSRASKYRDEMYRLNKIEIMPKREKPKADPDLKYKIYEAPPFFCSKNKKE